MEYDYSIFRRTRLAHSDIGNFEYDHLVSAFNDSKRVGQVFNLVAAKKKTWLLHHEYGYSETERPNETCWSPQDEDGIVDAIERLLDDLDISSSHSLVVDITGMMRPYIAVLPVVLKRAGFKKVTILYSDPVSYVSGHNTTFARGPVSKVETIPLFGGQHETSYQAKECLIIGAGYDHQLVAKVAESRRNAAHYVMVGMPGLQPHMYQESVYRVAQAKESINGFSSRRLLHAPANNPFMTAQVLSAHLASLKGQGAADNIYLAPVGSKSQVLGFAWYFLCEAQNSSTSMVFPYSVSYSRETSVGLGAVHSYDLELDLIP